MQKSSQKIILLLPFVTFLERKVTQRTLVMGFAIAVKLDINKNPPAIAGGISVSGIALILLAAHKCAFYWPVSHAFVT